MASYNELVKKYKKRRKDTLVDAVTTGLSYADNVAVEIGVLEDTGILTDALETASTVLPFAVIAITEQMKVVMGKKDGKTGLSDALFRMVKTGAALTVGAAAATAGGLVAAIPAAIGTRALIDRYKSRSLTALRVSRRTERLKSLRQLNAQRFAAQENTDEALYTAEIEHIS